MSRTKEEIRSFLIGALHEATKLDVVWFAGKMLQWLDADTNPIEPQHTLFYKELTDMNHLAKTVEIVDADEPSWKVKEYWFDSDNNVIMVNFTERGDTN